MLLERRLVVTRTLSLLVNNNVDEYEIGRTFLRDVTRTSRDDYLQHELFRQTRSRKIQMRYLIKTV